MPRTKSIRFIAKTLEQPWLVSLKNPLNGTAFDAEIYTEGYIILKCDRDRDGSVETYIKHDICFRTKSILFKGMEDIFVSLLFQKPNPCVYLKFLNTHVAKTQMLKIALSDYNGIRTHNYLVREQTQNGWVFIYELNGRRVESCCSHLNFRYHAYFEQRVLWYSGNFKVYIHTKNAFVAWTHSLKIGFLFPS